jgi:hypothetical protein
MNALIYYDATQRADASNGTSYTCVIFSCDWSLIICFDMCFKGSQQYFFGIAGAPMKRIA